MKPDGACQVRLRLELMPVVCAHQPNFLPWLGFFDKIGKSDIWVLEDSLQYVKDFINRNKIKRRDGSAQWLTIPIEKFNVGDRINEVRVTGTDWKIKHRRIIEESYYNAPYYATYSEEYFDKVYSVESPYLIDYNRRTIDFFLNLFNIQTEVVPLSSLKIQDGLKKADLLIAMVKAVGGSVYLSGSGAKAYLDESKFKQSGLELSWQQFQHPTYPQINGPFITNLSALDYLFNVGTKSPSSSQSFA